MPENTATSSTSSDGASAAAVVPVSALFNPQAVLGGCLLAGFVVEALLHGQPPGAGYAVASVAVALGWLLIGRTARARPAPTALALLAALVLVSLPVAVRASPRLAAINVLAGLALVLLVPAVFIPGRLGLFSLSDYTLGLLTGVLTALVQPFLLLFSDLPAAARARPAARAGQGRSLAPAARGLALAVPVLLIFGALFASADAVFAGYLAALFRWNLNALIGRLVLSLLLGWFAAGLARYAFTRSSAGPGLVTLTRPEALRLGATEAMIVLGLLNLLFAVFVAVQAVYLFGGADTLARSGLAHSEYARRGFFELVTVAALVLALVLSIDWLVRPRRGRAGLAVRALHGLLVLWTLAVLVSALQRMRLYQQEYGLTELRLYTTAFMGWVAAVLLWLAATVLPPGPVDGPAMGRQRFALGALIAALLLVLGLNIADPDAIIARTNVARAIGGAGHSLDAAYLTRTLSADAVPALVAGLPSVPDRDGARAALACGLRAEADRLALDAGGRDSRGANWGLIQARRALVEARPLLDKFGRSCSD